jgi:hypothetical protein
MLKKEVVVDNKVFDQETSAFVDSVSNREGKWPVMELEVCGTIFQVGVIRRENTLILNWWGWTPVENIYWSRWVFLRLGWNPVRKVSCFSFEPEDLCAS